MRGRDNFFAVVFVFLSCVTAAPMPRVDLLAQVVITDDASQHVLEEAFRWARTHQLETGGCFRIFAVHGDKIIVTDVEERVNWRREDRVSLDCPDHSPIWHTHYKPESGSSVGCNMPRAQDLYLIDKETPLGLVVCGLGRDSVIPYNYSAKADSLHKALLADYPKMKAEEDSLERVTNGHRCGNEPAESMKRSNINCKR